MVERLKRKNNEDSKNFVRNKTNMVIHPKKNFTWKLTLFLVIYPTNTGPIIPGRVATVFVKDIMTPVNGRLVKP